MNRIHIATFIIAVTIIGAVIVGAYSYYQAHPYDPYACYGTFQGDYYWNPSYPYPSDAWSVYISGTLVAKIEKGTWIAMRPQCILLSGPNEKEPSMNLQGDPNNIYASDTVDLASFSTRDGVPLHIQVYW